MKKYEPAGGTVALKWRDHLPDREQYGDIIAECWSLSFNSYDWHRRPEAEVCAHIYPLCWDYDGERWMYRDKPYDAAEHGRIRRWARLSINHARVSIKLTDW